ncbi:MAG: class I SAM-dependent methyltransferase [Lachnospiraceae bacterium]|nr:class I SAM-dependent methyltransferase [Lachnospiraceae bacterium]
MINEKEFEDFLSISTIEEGNQIKDTKAKYSIYEATHYEGLTRIFREVIMTPYDTLVDFGCGLGRVLFYCNHQYLCHVTGVEYDSDMYQGLQKNAEEYCKRFKNQEKKILLLNMKAEDYVVEPTDNYFYFFNPFSMEIMEQVFDNIMESLKKHPRKLTFILYYCTYEIMGIMRKYPFALEKIIKLPGYEEDPDEKAYVYGYEGN